MRLTLPFLLLLAACAQFPALDGTISDAARAAPYPTLQPLPTLQDAPPEDTEALVAARLAALNAKAEWLRKTPIATLQ